MMTLAEIRADVETIKRVAKDTQDWERVHTLVDALAEQILVEGVQVEVARWSPSEKCNWDFRTFLSRTCRRACA